MTKSDKRENIFLIASEPLTFEKGEDMLELVWLSRIWAYPSVSADWMEVRTNTMVGMLFYLLH